MSNIDTNTLIRYAVGALLIIAGAVLFYIGKYNEGLSVLGMGLAVLGVGTVGYALGYRRASAKIHIREK